MPVITFKAAHYIKLGRGGMWADDSIANNRLRFGWPGQTVDDINAGRWSLIEQQLIAGGRGKLGPIRADLNSLKRITLSDPAAEIWVTFHQAKLWWARITGPVVQDAICKFRETVSPWSDMTADGKLLVASELPGKIAKLQGFRATTCRVHQVDLLRRLLNSTHSPHAAAINNAKRTLAEALTAAIQELHWKDFETLADLVFRHAGWVRVSVLGQQAKGYDLELREPITDARFVVQVKSTAGLAEVLATAEQFDPNDYRKVFFVVHSPASDLADPVGLPEHVELVPPPRLGVLALDAGLADWLADKMA